MKFKIARLVHLLFLLLLAEPLFPQTVAVTGLEFEANDAISDGKLQKAIKTEANPWYYLFLFWKKSKIFDEKVFLNDLLRIEKFYHNEGYLEAIVKDYELNFNDEGDEVDIVVHIEEGEPTKVERMDFSPSNGVAIPFDDKTLRRITSLDPGDRYKQVDLRADYDAIIKEFSDNGYPYVSARVKPHIADDRNTVELTWLIEPGKYSEFGDITIRGNKSVSNGVIRRGLDFREGDVFSQKELHIAQSQIYRLELFRYVNLQAMKLKDRPRQIPILVELKERDPKAIELGVGYGSEEALRLRGDWTHRNFLGGARILKAEAKHSTLILPLSLELRLSQPFFFDNQNDLIVKPFFTWQDEESFEARRIGFETTFNRQLTDQTNVFITNRFSRDTVRVKNRIETDELDDFYNKSVLSTGIRRNTTDQLFSPTRGSILRFVAEEAGLIFQSKFRYYKLFGEYRYYHKLAPGWVFATRILAGTMDGFRGTQITPIEERFFAGGSYSVRGWGRQELGPQRFNSETESNTPVGGNSKIEGGVELRYPTYKKVTGAVFLDYGNIWPQWDGFDWLDLRYSAGIGVRYDTPIGPFRVDFAWKLNKQFASENRLQVHISIGQAF